MLYFDTYYCNQLSIIVDIILSMSIINLIIILQQVSMKENDQQQFDRYRAQRLTMNLPPKLESLFYFCEIILHIQLKKKKLIPLPNCKRKPEQLSEQYKRAIKSLNTSQKLAYYIDFIQLIKQYKTQPQKPPKQQKGMLTTPDAYSRSYNLKRWKLKTMRLHRQNHILYVEQIGSKSKQFFLDDYLIRKSKTKHYYCFVLEAINNKPPIKRKTMHLGFDNQEKFYCWFKELELVFKNVHWNFIHYEINAAKIKHNNDFSQKVNSERSKLEVEYEEPLSKSMVVYDHGLQNLYSDDNCIKTTIPQYDNSMIDSNIDIPIQNDSSEEQSNPNIRRLSKQSITQAIAQTKLADLPAIQTKTSQKEQDMDNIQQIKQDIFHRLIPAYNLDNLMEMTNYGLLYEEGKLKIMGHLEQSFQIKMFLSLPLEFSHKVILNGLTDVETLKKANKEIQQLSLKTLIKSQNSAMFYMKLKSYNRLYRCRDFIFLKHVFKTHNNIYIIDKSIENLSVPPFTTIVRGNLCILWGIIKKQQQCTLVADLMIKNQGYLNDTQNVNLILKFLKPFVHFQDIISNSYFNLEKFNLLNDDWNIKQEYIYQNGSQQYKKQKSNNEIAHNLDDKQQKRFKKKLSQQSPHKNTPSKQQHPKIKSQLNQQKLQQQYQQSRQYKSQIIPKLKQRYSNMQQYHGQIDQTYVLAQQKYQQHITNILHRSFNKNGCIVVNNNYVKIKYVLEPMAKKQTVYQDVVKGHPIWKGQWIHDQKIGGIIFVNKQKISQQNGVLKFVVTQIGKNLLSGKSVMNISLPVDIFSAESNLERLVYSLTYAPSQLQPAANEKNLIQRLKKVVAFGISNSPLYLNMQKPFNPILGQTFQCWIDGCPVYAQQISHHPPISAILFYGRGYRMAAQLQSKMQLHVNSGCGINQGTFKITFFDGIQICYMTPGGELSGLVYGDRKFNIVGKSYYWIEQKNIFLQLTFNPNKKGFFSMGKQIQPTDYFQGMICKVKKQFIQSFKIKKKPPLEKQIVEKIGKIHGIWNKYVKYQKQTIFQLDKQYPIKLQYQLNPLPSDSNWRQDIQYRRLLQISKSQTQKQRLQIQQRKDKKLRESSIYANKNKK